MFISKATPSKVTWCLYLKDPRPPELPDCFCLQEHSRPPEFPDCLFLKVYALASFLTVFISKIYTLSMFPDCAYSSSQIHTLPSSLTARKSPPSRIPRLSFSKINLFRFAWLSLFQRFTPPPPGFPDCLCFKYSRPSGLPGCLFCLTYSPEVPSSLLALSPTHGTGAYIFCWYILYLLLYFYINHYCANL